jgi:hypothetical protein
MAGNIVTTTTQIAWLGRPPCQEAPCSSITINRLRAAAAIAAVQIEGGNAWLAEGAFEHAAVMNRIGCGTSHIFHCSPYCPFVSGQWVCNLRAGNDVPQRGAPAANGVSLPLAEEIS